MMILHPKCGGWFGCQKNDVRVAVPRDGVYAADAWSCSKCGELLVMGFGRHPLTAHVAPRFTEDSAAADFTADAR